jgi:hypothetical protein
MKRNDKNERYVFFFDAIVYYRARRIAKKFFGSEAKTAMLIRKLINEQLDKYEKILGITDISPEELPEENRELLICQLNRAKLIEN